MYFRARNAFNLQAITFKLPNFANGKFPMYTPRRSTAKRADLKYRSASLSEVSRFIKTFLSIRLQGVHGREISKSQVVGSLIR